MISETIPHLGITKRFMNWIKNHPQGFDSTPLWYHIISHKCRNPFSKCFESSLRLTKYLCAPPADPSIGLSPATPFPRCNNSARRRRRRQRERERQIVDDVSQMPDKKCLCREGRGSPEATVMSSACVFVLYASASHLPSFTNEPK